MRYLIDSNEWRLLRGLGRQLEQRKGSLQERSDTGTRSMHSNVDLIEFDLRHFFLVTAQDFSGQLSEEEFEKCQEKLESLCSLLDTLALDQCVKSVPEGEVHPHRRLRGLLAYLETTSNTVDLIYGPRVKLFELSDNVSSLIGTVRECINCLDRLTSAPTQDAAVRPQQPREKRRNWKKARIRNQATSFLRNFFTSYQCEWPHEVLLELAEDPDEDLQLPSAQLMLHHCQETNRWQKASCESNNVDAISLSKINDICANMLEHADQSKALILYIEKAGLFGSWEKSHNTCMTPLCRESLEKLIKRGFFRPISHDINNLSKGVSPRDKRELAVKLGFCLMDFFDENFDSKAICFLQPPEPNIDGAGPYLSFSSRRTEPSISPIYLRGHPGFLSFAKLLLEIEYGQIIEDVNICLNNKQNHSAWLSLMDLVDRLEQEKTDSYLQAIRGCLVVHTHINEAIRSRELDTKDEEFRIRKKIYREVVKKLELSLGECIPRSSQKRRRSKSPPPTTAATRSQASDFRKMPRQSQESLEIQYSRNAVAPKPQQPVARMSELGLRKSSAFSDGSYDYTIEVKSTRPDRRRDFEIGIVCALPIEHDAVSLLIDEFWDEDGDPYGKADGDTNTYTTGRIGKFDVVLVLFDVGTNSAAGSAASLSSSFPSLKLVLLTGKCGGVPSEGTENELLLGDVVISKSVIQYDHGRGFPDKFELKDTDEDRIGRPSKEIRSLVQYFRTERGRDQLEKRASYFLQQLQQNSTNKPRRRKYQYPGTENDKLFPASLRHKHYRESNCACTNCHEAKDPVCDKSRKLPCNKVGCDETHLVPRERLEWKKQLEQRGMAEQAQAPSIFVGRVGSSNIVLKSGEDRDRIASEHEIMVFEMESAGIVDEVPCIVTKAVCDYADSHKNKSWQNFAAATAASVTKALLERCTWTDHERE